MNLVESGQITPAIRKWKTYPAYQESGVKWLGTVPLSWRVEPLGIKTRMIVPMRDKPPAFDGDTPWIRIEDFDGKYLSDSKSDQRVSEKTIRDMNLKVYPVGTVLCSCSCNMGATAIVNRPLISNQTFIGIVPTGGLISGYLYYQMQTAKEHLTALATGAIQQYLSRNDFQRLRVPVPPAADQETIANFLDRETAKIDALVKKKERLIELLQEKRSAIISQAVTKGLDLDVPMKDSGIEWLGKIPAHWDVAPLYARYEVALGKMLDTKRISGEYLAPYLRNVDVQWDRVNVDGLPEMDFAPADRSRYALHVGDLLVCKGGEVGRTAMWRGELEKCYYQKAVHRLRPIRGKDVARFFYYVMHATAKGGRFVAGGNPNTIDHLTAIQLKHYSFAFPPREEQMAIAGFLDREIAKLDALVAKVREGIEKLKEYRTALISAAVTGKIDVRGTIST